ncbi:hypothetical protein M0R45_010279 [Rubus argutus]|uniref:Uncharacterized protein n=1 Tax=Rubus argutus TaxID=59490 RepID=A0AAW1Y6V7_RUBAR
MAKNSKKLTMAKKSKEENSWTCRFFSFSLLLVAEIHLLQEAAGATAGVLVKAENLDYLVKLMNEGKLKAVIDSKYPLSKAEEAWAKNIDVHAIGKIIVEP